MHMAFICEQYFLNSAAGLNSGIERGLRVAVSTTIRIHDVCTHSHVNLGPEYMIDTGICSFPAQCQAFLGATSRVVDRQH